MTYHPNEYYQKLHELILKRMSLESSVEMKGLSPIDIDFKDIHGKTLLHYACEIGDIEKIKYCLENGANINLPTTTPPYGQTNAAVYGQTNLKPIEIALNAGHINAATLLMNANADCSTIPLANIKNMDGKKWFRNEIVNAVKNWQKNAFKFTIQDNFFPSATNPTIFNSGQINKFFHPVVRIAEINDNDLLVQLLKITFFKQTINRNKNDILFAAAANGNISFIDLVSREEINPQLSYAQSALHIAAENNQSEAIEHLLKLGAKIDKFNHRKNTALMEAAINGNAKIVSLLLKNGANPNLQNVSGKNVLHLAIENNQSEIIDILLKHEFTNEDDRKAFLNCANHFGFTPLDLALKSKNDIIKSSIIVEQIKANVSRDLRGAHCSDIRNLT